MGQSLVGSADLTKRICVADPFLSDQHTRRAAPRLQELTDHPFGGLRKPACLNRMYAIGACLLGEFHAGRGQEEKMQAFPEFSPNTGVYPALAAMLATA